MVEPNLFVDGRQYIVYWGRVDVEVPADRAVHVFHGRNTVKPGGDRAWLPFSG